MRIWHSGAQWAVILGPLKAFRFTMEGRPHWAVWLGEWCLYDGARWGRR